MKAEGAEWVQLDEPCLALDLDATARDALRQAYATFSEALPELKIMLTTYFGGLGDNLNTAMSLPVTGLHIDLVRAPANRACISLPPLYPHLRHQRIDEIRLVDVRSA